MTIEEELADLKRRLAAIEQRLGPAPIVPQPAWPAQRPSITEPWTWQRGLRASDCGCPDGTLCMRVDCPHRPQVVANTLG